MRRTQPIIGKKSSTTNFRLQRWSHGKQKQHKCLISFTINKTLLCFFSGVEFSIHNTVLEVNVWSKIWCVHQILTNITKPSKKKVSWLRSRLNEHMLLEIINKKTCMAWTIGLRTLNRPDRDTMVGSWSGSGFQDLVGSVSGSSTLLYREKCFYTPLSSYQRG